jgi:hypothetical protein
VIAAEAERGAPGSGRQSAVAVTFGGSAVL